MAGGQEPVPADLPREEIGPFESFWKRVYVRETMERLPALV